MVFPFKRDSQEIKIWTRIVFINWKATYCFMLYSTSTRVSSPIAWMWFAVALQRVRNWGWFLTNSMFFSKLVFCFWNCQSILNTQPTCGSESMAGLLSIRSNTCSSSVQFCIWIINGLQLKGRNWTTLRESRERPLRQNIFITDGSPKYRLLFLC